MIGYVMLLMFIPHNPNNPQEVSLDRLPLSAMRTSVDEVTDELHIGNKWLGHSGLNMYDNTARMHDPVLMRFASPDPLYARLPRLFALTRTANRPGFYPADARFASPTPLGVVCYISA